MMSPNDDRTYPAKYEGKQVKFIGCYHNPKTPRVYSDCVDCKGCEFYLVKPVISGREYRALEQIDYIRIGDVVSCELENRIERMAQ